VTTAIERSSTIDEHSAARLDDAQAVATLALLGAVQFALVGLTVARSAVSAVAQRTRSATARPRSPRGYTAEQIMTGSPVACRPEDALTEAARIMWQHDCGCVPVVCNDGRLCGLITDRDICMAAYLQGRPLAAIRVDDVMARHVTACAPQDSLQEVARAMREARVRRIPVVEDDGVLVGIVSLADLALEPERRGDARTQSAARKQVVATLASIVRPRRT
jgi:CBS domain-containing protein